LGVNESLGLYASQKAVEQRTQQVTVTSTNHPYQSSAPKPKSFKEILRECYWKREQLKRDRDVNARELAFMRRLERRQLFGYVLTINGLTLTIDEARKQMEKGKLTKQEILDWHNPEIYTDNVLSIGEKDVPKEYFYPALGLEEGDVLKDPKLRYLNPRLRIR
jgi:hypothetical protein